MVGRCWNRLHHYETESTGASAPRYVNFYRELLKYAITLDKIERDMGRGIVL